MLTIEEVQNKNMYKWRVSDTKLENVANKEKVLPKNYISADGFGITEKCKKYVQNLIKGEDYPNYKNGLPDYAKLSHPLVKKKLKKFK